MWSDCVIYCSNGDTLEGKRDNVKGMSGQQGPSGANQDVLSPELDITTARGVRIVRSRSQGGAKTLSPDLGDSELG